MNFTYANYQDAVNKAQNNSGFVKVGFFKLSEGDEAVVRFNVGSVEDLSFATVHKAVYGERYNGLPGFGGISCLNPFGSTANNCPLCAAAAAGHKVVDKAKKLVYVQMLVSYKDKATGTWTTPQPVVWERPAGFSREIATILNEYGDMRARLFKLSRTGQKTETRYTILPIDKDSPVFKQEMIPSDFSAFNNFNIAKHSYWEKTAAEINDYFTTGSFPEPVKAAQPAPAAQPTYTVPAVEPTPVAQPATAQYGAAFVPPVVSQPAAAPAEQSYIPPVAPQTYATPAPQAAPTQPVTEQPARNFGNSNFGGFKF